MNEFLTDNIRKAYPLERELPAGTPPLWGHLLSDACIGVSAEVGDGRVSLLSVQRVVGTSGSRLNLRIGVSGVVSRDVSIGPGLGDFVTVPVSVTSGTLKAMLVVNGKVADAIIADEDYGTAAIVVDTPFALRCVSVGHKRVTAVTAYSAPQCTTPLFSLDDEPVKEISGGDVVLAAKDGVDLETTELMPLSGRLLRISAVAAPAGTAESDEEVDLMIRGDGCFTVETLPGTKVSGGAVVARTASEPDGRGVLGGGVVRIGNSCKPCCQCDDYKAVVDVLRSREEATFAIEQALNDAKRMYDEAVELFNATKAAARATINSYANVRCRAVAATSASGYGSSSAKGTRARIAVTLYVENMTEKTVQVSVNSFTVSGFSTTVSTAWTKVGSGGTTTGTTLPSSLALGTGDTLAVTRTCAKANTTSNTVTKPSGMKVNVTLAMEGQSPTTKDIAVS